MTYLYHAVPENMIGSTLYPLSQLETRIPELYDQYCKKYQGREHVMQQTIPTLSNALWNSVVFLTAVHPRLIKKELERIDGDSKPLWRYYEIDPRTLDQTNATVFLFEDSNFSRPLAANDFTAYDPENLKLFSSIPQSTIDYWETFEFTPEMPKMRLRYMHIPHILYHGTIDVSNAQIITV